MFLTGEEGHLKKQIQAYVSFMWLLHLDYDWDFCLWNTLYNYKLIH